MTDFVYHMWGTETTDLYNTWSALVALSAVLRRNTWYELYGEPLFTNLYILLVGPAGLAMKSTVTEEVQRVLLYYNTLWAETPYAPVKRVVTITDDYSSESIIQVLSRSPNRVILRDKESGEILTDRALKPLSYYPDSSCVILADEITATLRNRYQQGNLEFLKAIYSNKVAHEQRTKASGLLVMRNLHTNFMGNTTLAGLTGIPRELYSDGFLSRLNIVYSFMTDREYAHRFVPTGAPSYDDLVEGLRLVSLLHQGAMRPTEEAAAWYESWYYGMKKKLKLDPEQAGMLSRMQLFVRKIATLFAAAEYEESNEVTLEHFLDADRLLRFTYAQNPLVGTDVIEAPQEKAPHLSFFPVYERITQLLYLRRAEWHTPATLQRRVSISGKRPDSHLIKRILGELEKNGKIEKDGGRVKWKTGEDKE